MSEIAAVFCRIDDPGTMETFLEEMFTPAERRDLELRWKSVKMIHKKIPQRKIASELGISLCKITRGSKVLKKKTSVAKALLEGDY
jgi:TrpR family trp operon transcriptional repressor